MTEFIFRQSARERDQQLRSTQAPHNMKGMLADVIRTPQEARDMAQRMGGHDIKPRRGVLVERDGNRTVIMGDGIATADELSELAQSVYEKKPVDFDELRERSGQMRREDVGPKMREAFADRVARAKKNERTDPAKYVAEAKRKAAGR